jgi:hypothetical protein
MGHINHLPFDIIAFPIITYHIIATVQILGIAPLVNDGANGMRTHANIMQDI